MRVKYGVLLGATCFGLLFWVIDAVVDVCWFYDAPFRDLLFADIPPQEAYVRVVVLCLFVIAGLVMSAALSARERTRQALRASEDRYRMVVETMNEGVVVRNRKGHIVYANDRFCEVTGYSPEELIETGGAQLLDEVNRRILEQELARRREGGTEPYEIDFTVKDGRVISVRVSPRAIYDHKGEFHGSFAILMDITDRKRAEEALRQEKNLAQMYLDVVGVIVMLLRPDGTIGLINKRGCEVLEGSEGEIVGRSWFDTFVPHEERDARWTRFREMVRGRCEQPLREEGRIVTLRGNTRQLAWHNTPVCNNDRDVSGLLSSGEDVTEQRQTESEKQQLEAQLRQAQKMEAVGQLAGGVAHDFNNVLTAILGNTEIALEMLQGNLPADSPILMGLQQVEQAGLRAAALTRQLLAFSRRQVVKREVFSPNDVLHNLEKMLRRLLTEDIALKIVTAGDVPRIYADVGQFEQVIMNLVVNARDAMGQGGVLRLETATADLDEQHAALHPGAQVGPHAVLVASDTGCGMSRDTLERIYEPFFTTKPLGKGTGLGLATVYAIVREAGGHIVVYSEPDEGTTFRIFFPAAEQPAEDSLRRAEEEASLAGTETVLVCEDDDTVRTLAAQILRSAGYQVITAEDGHRALESVDKRNGRIDALLTDVIMPDMNGKELADHLAARDPSIRTLFVSGYTADVIAHHGVLAEGVELLEKPFTRHGLLRRVRGLLDSPSGHAPAARSLSGAVYPKLPETHATRGPASSSTGQSAR